jgi:hypothetical protein
MAMQPTLNKQVFVHAYLRALISLELLATGTILTFLKNCLVISNRVIKDKQELQTLELFGNLWGPGGSVAGKREDQIT